MGNARNEESMRNTKRSPRNFAGENDLGDERRHRSSEHRKRIRLEMAKKRGAVKRTRNRHP
jgi:hypothetical protein